MGVRQGLGTLIKQRDNKAQIKKQRHPIKEKKIQRHSNKFIVNSEQTHIEVGFLNLRTD